jgi:hypothetical protein
MRTALLLLVLLAAPALAGQTVWKWVDEKGVTHYSDQPIPGAQRVEITTTKAGTVTAGQPLSSDDITRPQFPGYRLAVVRPANDETIVNTAGTVDVRLSIEPSLQPGHALYLYLDGKIVPDFPGNALQYTLRDVPRGTHSIGAVVQDNRGVRVQETFASFTVRQESIANPPVGPTLRPPPKPQPRN